MRDNLLIQTNMIDAAYREAAQAAVSRLELHLSEARAAADAGRYLLTGPLEPTNEWYAIAKIAGLKMCQAYRRQYGFNAISAMPTNLYGPGDNFGLQNSHVLPALMRKFHEAKDAALTRRGLGHRQTAPRVPARRRSGGCRAAARAVRRESKSMSAAVRTSPSRAVPDRHGGYRIPGQIGVRIPGNPTEHRENYWT